MKKTNGITRRDFLKGSAAGALSVAAMGLLGACSSKEGAGSDNDSAVESTISETPAWLGQEPETGEIAETIETEVLVVGSGTAGWPAALSAAENGAKVLMIERYAYLNKPKDDIGAINSKLQQETIKNYPYLAIDKTKLLKDAVRYANGYIDSDLVKLWMEESGETVDWYTEILERKGDFKMWHEGGIGNVDGGARDAAYATGHSPEALTERTTAEVLKEYADELGVETMLETTLIKLIKTEGRVSGIIAESAEKGRIQINASKGVILCTGGYSGNAEMLKSLQPETVRISATGINMTSADDGSGIKAALWAGADMDQIHSTCSFNRAAVDPKNGKGGDPGVWYWFGEQPFMKVNTKGVRFCNESGPYDYMLHSASLQPNHVYCQIFDANMKEHVKQMEMVGCCRLYPFDNGAPSNMDIDTVVDGMNAGLIESGHLVVADTLEELADGLNLPKEAFLAQVERYNHYAETGVDEEYGKVAYRITPIDTPPFYGARTCAWLLSTLDGIRIDTNMNAIDENNEPIPGLYVCGDASGGFFGNTYFNLVTGMACGRSMTFGRRAGRIAATTAL